MPNRGICQNGEDSKIVNRFNRPAYLAPGGWYLEHTRCTMRFSHSCALREAIGDGKRGSLYGW